MIDSTAYKTTFCDASIARTVCVSPIDLCSPLEAMAVLDLDQTSLLGLVNAGELAAYRIGSSVRFRRCDLLLLV